MTFVEADVADDTAVKELVAMTVRTYGGLDCAVNNAGTEATGLIADSDDDDMIWRFLDSQGIPPEQLVSMFPVGRMGRPEEHVHRSRRHRQS